MRAHRRSAPVYEKAPRERWVASAQRGNLEVQVVQPYRVRVANEPTSTCTLRMCVRAAEYEYPSDPFTAAARRRKVAPGEPRIGELWQAKVTIRENLVLKAFTFHCVVLHYNIRTPRPHRATSLSSAAHSHVPRTPRQPKPTWSIRCVRQVNPTPRATFGYMRAAPDSA